MKEFKRPKFDRRGSLFGGLVVVEGDDEKIMLEDKIRKLKDQLKDKSVLNPGAIHNNLANALMSSDNIMEAISHYKEALAMNPGDAAAYMNLGIAYKHMNKFDEALEYFKKSLELRPTADEHYNMANTFVKLVPPDNASAIKHYKEALRIDPTHANCHQNLGLALKNSGQIDAAILEMKQAVKKGGMDANFSYNLGNALFTKGVTMGKREALEEAVKVFLDAVNMKPDDPDIRTNLGIALNELNRPAEAVAQYQEVMRLQPGDGQTHYNCGNALVMQGLTDQAIEQFREALILLPNHYDSSYNLSMTLMKAEKFEESIEVMENLLLYEDEVEGGLGWGESERDGKGDIAMLHYNLGTMKGKLGMVEEAIKNLRTCIEIDPSNAYAHLNLGNYLASLKDRNGALDAYREACRISPKDPKMLRNLSYCLVERGDLGEGTDCLRKLLELTPGDEEITSYLEQCESELKISLQIKADIKKGLSDVEKEPNSLGIRANLAMAMKADGNLEGSAEQFEECLKLQPGHPQITEMLQQCKDAISAKKGSGGGGGGDAIEPGSIQEEKIVKATGRFSMFGNKKKGRGMGGGKKRVAVAG